MAFRFSSTSTPSTGSQVFSPHSRHRGPMEDRSTATGKGTAAGIGLGILAGIAIVLLIPEELGAAGAIIVIAGTTAVTGAAGYAGVQAGLASGSAGGTDANQGDSNQSGAGSGAGGDNQGTGSTGDSAGGIGGSGCFPAGTPVLLADGNIKSIEAIQPGDIVVSQDLATGHVTAQPILKLFRHHADSTLKLHLSDGSCIETTGQHRFYVSGKGFVAAGKLEPGSELATYDNRHPTLSNAESISVATSVFNLEVANFHTFFVGQDRLWVHNDKDVNQPD
jgi:hypothetical protein